MKIINKTNGATLAEDVVVANTPFKRMRGLLARKEFHKGQALILEPCNSIHTLFMRFPIDVLFVDKNNRLVKALPCLKPFRLSGIYFNSAFAIELPAGTIQATNTHKGDTLLLRDTLSANRQGVPLSIIKLNQENPKADSCYQIFYLYSYSRDNLPAT